jgi:hypothetical protein
MCADTVLGNFLIPLCPSIPPASRLLGVERFAIDAGLGPVVTIDVLFGQ